ncbi:peptide-methionine (S)-S-oxide reductase [Pseudaminobacter arsenicus]|uniref:Peptide methionine sulfoxide reductase MsrA n=1 Tax=Borborobacter arsenicus TaxID=1851146 RepID=A0A432V8B0_9HYPH|nr:peptide-methionine (S)-S-oxide reductase MsrA [Pseudaminobacter arsenicus]RUM98422.1 peptide-methionine (S)-S-oxide reductase [Pseudaminobacter arsenicus]
MLRKAVTLSTFTLAAALMLPAGAALSKSQTAIFAGGCFWCVESDFDSVPGVISTTSGYIGGTSQNPTYEDHTAAGHREAVRIEFDDAKVSYDQLLDVFWHSVDPTDGGGQFCDRGHSYTTAIYAVDMQQLAEARKSEAAVAAVLKKPVATEIAPAPSFWPAEDYHQDYYRKNPLRYKYYRYACGRDARLEEVWGSAARQGIAAH